tara:strand:+ start:2664 stop:3362 length:699 start_codon:yes stop_codon:yes gene_type:complete
MRLNKYLARSGCASRRACDKLIEEGRVKVNGAIMLDFSCQVDNDDVIMCDGKIINQIADSEVFLAHKLKGYISTSQDPYGRKKVIDMIKTKNRLFTIGRLDRDTTGAILLTNDGELANKLMHPKYNIERIYLVATKVDILKSEYSKLEAGISIDKNFKVKGKIIRLGKKGGLVHWRIILHEGKNHEVKRIFKYFGSTVIHLHRESFAGFSVENILPGKYRKVTKKELNKILS